MDFRFYKKLGILFFDKKIEVTAYKQGLCSALKYFVHSEFVLFADLFGQQTLRTASASTVIVPEGFKSSAENDGRVLFYSTVLRISWEEWVKPS